MRKRRASRLKPIKTTTKRRSLPILFYTQRLEALAALHEQHAAAGIVNELALRLVIDGVGYTQRLNGVPFTKVDDTQLNPAFLGFSIGERI